MREFRFRRRGCYITDSYGPSLENARPPVAPIIGGGMAPGISFPGIVRPTSDFQAVRDGRRALLYYIDVDLGTARSVAAGTQADVIIQGNFLYIDQRQNTGFATLHFQDENPAATGVTVFAGALWKIPFTRVAVENAAQPGASLRFIYGTDVDALPISAAGVTILNALNISDVVNLSCQILQYGNGATTVGTNINLILAPALNVRGVVVRSVYLEANATGAGNITAAIIAAATAPVGLAAKTSALLLAKIANGGTPVVLFQNPGLFRTLPVGWGVWEVDITGVAVGQVDAEISLEVL